MIYIGSVSRARFELDFPRTVGLLQRLGGERGAEPAHSQDVPATHFDFSRYVGLPPADRSWLWAAMGGLFSPVGEGQHSAEHVAETAWAWDGFTEAGYVTHVSSDVCFADELSDWWRSEESPRLPNISDHPSLLDTFCKRRPTPRSADPAEPASFQSRCAESISPRSDLRDYISEIAAHIVSRRGGLKTAGTFN